ncbi:MAG: glycoside hydrolase family 18 [Cytophagales bacterium]|nr:glycoside hydrolase family 18 [Cytophagales bacterium]
MHRIYKHILGVVFVSLFAACDDWTEIESVEIENNNFKSENPEAYAQYLENLRNYKKSPHKISYITLDNGTQESISLEHYIRALPDSLDMASFRFSNRLTQMENEEMKKVQSEKGTKFIVTIDHDEIRWAYEKERNKLKDAGDEEALKQFPDFASCFIDSLQNSIKAVNEYGYDGISFRFRGDCYQFQEEIEKMENKRQQSLLVEMIKRWKSKNEGKLLLFEGFPQNLLDKSFLSECDYIIVVAGKVLGPAGVNLNILSTISESVPIDRFIVAVDYVSNDPQKADQGYWGVDNKVRAIDGVVEYVTSEHEKYTTVGMGVYEVNLDFYSSIGVFGNVRRAIGKMNRH